MVNNKDETVTNKDKRLRIEVAYGVPGQMSWTYNAIRNLDGKIVLEGEVVKDGKDYNVFINSPEETRGTRLARSEDPENANSAVLSLLEARASSMLDAQK
jgi:hypothetical protein